MKYRQLSNIWIHFFSRLRIFFASSCIVSLQVRSIEKSKKIWFYSVFTQVLWILQKLTVSNCALLRNRDFFDLALKFPKINRGQLRSIEKFLILQLFHSFFPKSNSQQLRSIDNSLWIWLKKAISICRQLLFASFPSIRLSPLLHRHLFVIVFMNWRTRTSFASVTWGSLKN